MRTFCFRLQRALNPQPNLHSHSQREGVQIWVCVCSYVAGIASVRLPNLGVFDLCHFTYSKGAVRVGLELADVFSYFARSPDKFCGSFFEFLNSGTFGMKIRNIRGTFVLQFFRPNFPQRPCHTKNSTVIVIHYGGSKTLRLGL